MPIHRAVFTVSGADTSKTTIAWYFKDVLVPGQSGLELNDTILSPGQFGGLLRAVVTITDYENRSRSATTNSVYIDREEGVIDTPPVDGGSGTSIAITASTDLTWPNPIVFNVEDL